MSHNPLYRGHLWAHHFTGNLNWLTERLQQFSWWFLSEFDPVMLEGWTLFLRLSFTITFTGILNRIVDIFNSSALYAGGEKHKLCY